MELLMEVFLAAIIAVLAIFLFRLAVKAFAIAHIGE
jgi:hypothetical protein